MKRNFDDLLHAYMSFVAGHEATPRIHTWSFISVIAATLERRVWLDRGYLTLFPNLYVFIIGRSGLVKKSTSTGIAVNMFRELEGAQLMSDRLTAGSLIHQMQNSGKRFDYQGKTIVHSPLYAYASELAVFMEEVFGNITTLLTTFYDCVPHDSTKPWVYSNVGKGPTKIYGPCLNMLGASTKTWLTRCIPASEMEGGFSSRCIFVVENDVPKTLVAWPSLNSALNLMRMGIIADLNRIYEMKGPMHPSDAAKELFTKWYEYHMRQVLPYNQDPRMVGYMARKGDLLLKLGMIRSASLGDSMIIEAKHLTWAEEQLGILEPDMRDAFGGHATRGKDDLPFEIRNYVRKRGKVTKPQLLRIFAIRHLASEIQESLADLINMKDLIEVKTVDKAGVEEITYTFTGSDLSLI